MRLLKYFAKWGFAICILQWLLLISIQTFLSNQALVKLYVEGLTGEVVFCISTTTHKQIFTVELVRKERFLGNNQR